MGGEVAGQRASDRSDVVAAPLGRDLCNFLDRGLRSDSTPGTIHLSESPRPVGSRVWSVFR